MGRVFPGVVEVGPFAAEVVTWAPQVFPLRLREPPLAVKGGSRGIQVAHRIARVELPSGGSGPLIGNCRHRIVWCVTYESHPCFHSRRTDAGHARVHPGVDGEILGGNLPAGVRGGGGDLRDDLESQEVRIAHGGSEGGG